MMVALIRRSPNGMLSLRPVFRPFRLLEEAEQMARSAFDTDITPKTDMFEEDGHVVVKSEMPGVSKKDLDISLEGDILTIKAEKKEEKEEGEKGTTNYTRERHFGQYVRYISLPTRVDPDNITATLKKGLLEIRMPKAEAPKARQIEIKAK
jgi:HSP20 family protein